jgi:cysteine desulfurase
VGALYVRTGTKLEPLIHGGGHESGRRAGTESAMLAAGLGSACALAEDLSWARHTCELRDYMWGELRQRLGGRIVLNGHVEHRLPNTLNMSVVGRPGAEVLAALDGIAASTGSACHSGRVELSPVLRAMGIAVEAGIGAIRFSLGRDTTHEEIATTVERMTEIVRRS